MSGSIGAIGSIGGGGGAPPPPSQPSGGGGGAQQAQQGDDDKGDDNDQQQQNQGLDPNSLARYEVPGQTGADVVQFADE